MVKLALFASGSGSNAENIIMYFQKEPQITVSCICTNRPDAFVIERAKRFNIPYMIFNRDDFYHRETVLEYLKEREINWIILAGFLWLVPVNLMNHYAGRIINIHPALLPKFGGKGMYGHHVHQAVLDAGESFSGITIHYVDPEYDRGDIIFQAECRVEPGDTADMLAAKVHALEYEHFPRVIKETVLKQESNHGS
jgi:phosphoribosylglycinamide formyltransferase-1